MRAILKIAAATVVAIGASGCGANTEHVEMTSGAMSSSEGKPGAPVSLAFRLPAKPAVGAAIEIALTVTIDSRVDKAEISMAGSDGLELVGAPSLSLDAQEPGSVHKMTVSVIPWEAGLRFLNVFASTETNGQTRRRSFAVPVAGGGDQTRKLQSGKVEQMPDGEKVISLPAEEDNN